jgi:hypothetical protein
MAAVSLKIGKKTIETDAIDIDIGTRSSCIATINDPVAAAQHAWIRRRGGLVFVEDAGSASGTWKNGHDVTRAERLADGDVLVVGCTKIQVKIVPAAPVPRIELSFSEKSFFFEPSKKHQVKIGGHEMTVVSGDAERWVRDEVAFGRFRALLGANTVAFAVALLVLVLFGFHAPGRSLVQPGDLHARHAAIFADGASALTVGLSQDAFAFAVENGCSSCHDAFGGTPADKCKLCHAELMQERHPFVTDRSKAPLTHRIVLDEGVCSDCHVDHQGGEPAPATFVPAGEMLARSCERCHTAGVPKAESRRLEPAASETRRIAYDAFPHVKHAGVSCETCHGRSTSGDTADAERDFAVVGFTACMACHASDDPASKFRRDPVIASRTEPVDEEHLVTLTWHGSKQTAGQPSRCLACHSSVFDGALRQVQTRDVEHLTMQARRRGHRELFIDHVSVLDASGKKRECIECHVAGAPPRAGDEYAGRFEHAQHVAVLAPADAGAARASSSACAACHSEQAASMHLIGRSGPASDDVTSAPTYRGPDLQACAACHKDENNTLLITRVDEPAEGKVGSRTDFPHALHTNTTRASLAEGCFACHSFASAGDGLLAQPTDRDAIASSSCLPCHDAHANVGGDGCALCHPDSDGKVDIAFLGPGTRDERAFAKGSRSPGFSHQTRGHDGGGGGCLACHTNADKAATIREVHMPSETDASCWKCHVEERRQFHWRGAPAAAR